MKYLIFIFIYTAIFLYEIVNSIEISLRCLVFVEGRDPTSQSVSVFDIDNSKRVDSLKSKIRKEWRLRKYDPSQISLHKLTKGIPTNKLIDSYFNNEEKKGSEMLPV